jgi:Subtilase family
VFGDALRTDGVTVAHAIGWLVDQGVAVINLSLGVRQDHAPLRVACERAQARGCLVIASTPARGEPVFPAAYPGVIRVMGDARCGPSQHSALLLPHADFGACVLPPDGDRAHAGASLGSAHLSGRVAALLAGGVAPGRASVWQALVDSAAFHGPERKTL